MAQPDVRKAKTSPDPPAINGRASVVETILWPVLFLIIVVYGLSLLHGGYLFYEGQFFLSNYLDGRGLFQKVFSTHFSNWDCYQARELSFLFGLLDAQAIVIGSRLGFPFLYSVTSIVSVFVAAILVWRLIPRIAPRLSLTDAGLIVSLMLSTPAAALSSYYYRPGKALVAVFLVIACWQVFRMTTGERARSSALDSVLLFLSATLLAWSDPQGVFFVLLLASVVVGIIGLRSPPARLTLVVLFSTLAANAFWRSAIGPMLSRIADGFVPNTAYERIAPRATFFNPSNYWNAISLWRDDIGNFFGGSGAIGAVICLILIAVAYWMRPAANTADKGVQRHRVFVVFLLVAAMLLALYTAMYAKLPSIVWPESRLVYYWIPEMVILAIIVAGACDSVFALSDRFRTPVSLIFGLMICSSLLSLPHDEDLVRLGEMHAVIAESDLVRDCMRNAQKPIAGYRLTAGGAQACLSVRLAAFGSSGPGPAIKAAVPNPLLWCRRAPKH